MARKKLTLYTDCVSIRKPDTMTINFIYTSN